MNRRSILVFNVFKYCQLVLFIGIYMLLCTDVKSQELTWAKSVGGQTYQIAIDSDIDSQGNLFVIGHSGDATLETENTTYTANGNGGDVFIMKYDPSGQLLWCKMVGGDHNGYYDKGFDIHIDNNDDVYILLQARGANFTYDGSILFGTNFSSQYVGEGVLLKVDNDGNYLWRSDNPGPHAFKSIVNDSNNNIYVTGWFNITASFGDSITFTNSTNGWTSDMFIVKYSPSGDVLWAKHAGGLVHNTFAYGHKIAIDEASNKVIILGRFSKDIIFETDTITLPNYADAAFMVAYDTNGTELWVKSIFNSYLGPYCTGLDISDTGLVGVSGVDNYLDGGIIGFYDLNGDIQSEVIYDSTTYSEFYSLEFNEDDGYYVSGIFKDSVTVGDTTLYDLYNDPNITHNNGVVFKFDSTNSLTWGTRIPTSFENKVTYKNNRLTYVARLHQPYLSYYYGIDTIHNASMSGGGDAFIAEITEPLCPATIDIDAYSSCDELVWIDSNTYTSSNNNARYVLTNSNGCDSVIQLNYTRHQPTSGVDVQTSCYKILWIDGLAYTESNNTATHTLTNVNGCDSIVTLDLTIGVEDVGTTVVDSTILADIAGQTYQWLNCNEGFTTIGGATSQSYSPENNGSYAVEITQNGCVDTSECQSINIINTVEYNYFEDIKLYPNPSSDVFNIDFLNEIEDAKLIVTNLQGQVILRQNLKNVSKTKINLQDQNSGMYLLSLRSNLGQKVILLVKR